MIVADAFLIEDPFLRALEMVQARRSYHAYEFVYDVHKNKFWHVYDLLPYPAFSVDSMVPRSEWKLSERGVPIKPTDWIKRAENGCIVEGAVCAPGKDRIIVKDNGLRLLNVCYWKGKA